MLEGIPNKKRLIFPIKNDNVTSYYSYCSISFAEKADLRLENLSAFNRPVKIVEKSSATALKKLCIV